MNKTVYHNECRKRRLEIVYRSIGGLDLDPAYVDTIIRRWQTLSGESALHGISGLSFDDLVREAEAVHAA